MSDKYFHIAVINLLYYRDSSFATIFFKIFLNLQLSIVSDNHFSWIKEFKTEYLLIYKGIVVW